MTQSVRVAGRKKILATGRPNESGGSVAQGLTDVRAGCGSCVQIGEMHQLHFAHRTVRLSCIAWGWTRVTVRRVERSTGQIK